MILVLQFLKKSLSISEIYSEMFKDEVTSCAICSKRLKVEGQRIRWGFK